MSKWTDILLSKIQTLLGERGSKADHAVRWRDLTGGGGTMATGITARDPRVDGVLEDIDTLEGGVLTAQQAADLAALDALAADNKAQAVRNDHDALVGGFVGTLDGLDATLKDVQTDLNDAYDSLSGQIRASALSAYYTSVQTNQAIVAESTTLQASISKVNESVQGWQVVTDNVADVTAGADTTVTQGSATLGQAGTIIVSQVSAGGGQSGAWLAVPVERAILFSGQRIKIGVLARKPAVNASTRFNIIYATNDNSSDFMESDPDLTPDWQWFTFYYDVPQAVTGGPGYLFIYGDAALAGNGVEIARVYIEIAAVAGELPEIGSLTGEITDIKGLDLNALNGTAFGALLTQLDVQANGLSATITTQGSAIADLEGNASAGYLIKAQAGGAVSLIDLIAADGSGLTPSSFVRIKADDILLDGSVSMRKLVVHDNSAVFSEVFEDDGALLDWQNYAGSGELAIVETAYAKQGGKALRVGNNSGDDQAWYVARTLIPFDPDRTYRIRAGVRKNAGAGMIYLGFVGVAADGVTLVNNTGANTHTAQFYAPSGGQSPALNTYTEITGYVRGVGSGGAGTLASPRMIHANVRYLRPVIIVNFENVAGQTLVDYVKVDTVSDATLIADGAITAPKISVTELSAITATIGLLRTATSGARMELHSDKLIVYDASNVARVRIGNLS